MNNQDYYFTSDLSLASSIIASWFPLDHIQKENGKGTFFFEPSYRLTQLAEDYFFGRVRVDPLEFSTINRKMKNMLYNS